jgi:hypothetical protein
MSKRRMVDVPDNIGPVVFGVRVGWVMIQCPRQYDDLLRRAGATWDPDVRQWCIERRIEPVIRELEREVDPLFAQAGIRLA